MKPLDLADKARLSARPTRSVMILSGGDRLMPKRRHLKLRWDGDRPYVHVGRRTDRHREYLAEANTVIPGQLYSFRTEQEVELIKREREAFEARFPDMA